MSEQTLSGRVAVITGASRGLGKSMALALAEAGVSVALVGRDEAALDAVKREAITRGAAEAAWFRADITEEEQVRAMERQVIAQFGAVHILINNAGINIRKNLEDFALEEWRRVMDSNVTSAFLVSRSFIPHMRGHGYGRIINLCSIMSHVSLPGRAAYSASKSALLGMTRSLALELTSEGITVVANQPGSVRDRNEHYADAKPGNKRPIHLKDTRGPLGQGRRDRQPRAVLVLGRRRLHNRDRHPDRRRMVCAIASSPR